MEGKWPYFTMGIMVGIIGALSVALAMSSGALGASASPRVGVDNLNGSLVAGTGGMAANEHDMFWVLYKRTGAVDAGGGGKAEGGGLAAPEERITLALYKPPAGSKTEPTIKLQSVREITWDLMLQQHPAKKGKDFEPTVQDVIKALQESKEKEGGNKGK